MSIERRIRKLEAGRAGRPPELGIRTFEEGKDTAGEFYELEGAFYAGPQAYSHDEISALCKAGWTCIVVIRPRSEKEAPHG